MGMARAGSSESDVSPVVDTSAPAPADFRDVDPTGGRDVFWRIPTARARYSWGLVVEGAHATDLNCGAGVPWICGASTDDNDLLVDPITRTDPIIGTFSMTYDPALPKIPPGVLHAPGSSPLLSVNGHDAPSPLDHTVADAFLGVPGYLPGVALAGVPLANIRVRLDGVTVDDEGFLRP